MTRISDIKQAFQDNVQDCNELFKYCISSRGKHTEPGVEAAFLQLHRAWEVFLEDTILGYLVDEKPLNGSSIKVKFTVPDIETGRKLLYQGRQYCEWTREDVVFNRIDIFFYKPNIIEDSLSPIILELKEIVKIRNVIAHSSSSAYDSFKKMCQGKIGGNPDMDRAAKFLLHKDRENQPSTYFERYSTCLEVAANGITGNPETP